MPTAQRTFAANEDLRSIAFEIGSFHRRPSIADRIIDELIEQCNSIARLAPVAVLGTATPQLGEEVRIIGYKRWVIIFRYVTDGVVILRIADGSQDYLSWELPQS